MDKGFFEDFTLHLDKDRIDLAASKLEIEEEKEDKAIQKSKPFASFSLQERQIKQDSKDSEWEENEIIGSSSSDASEMSLGVEEELTEFDEEEKLRIGDVEGIEIDKEDTPLINDAVNSITEFDEEEKLRIGDVEGIEIDKEDTPLINDAVNSITELDEEEKLRIGDVEGIEIDKEDVSSIDWNNIVDEPVVELAKEEHKKSELNQIENNLSPDLPEDDIAKWNLFNYEDDGDVLEDYKDNMDFSWPDREAGGDGIVDDIGQAEEKIPEQENSKDTISKNKENIWDEKSQVELKEVFVYLDDLFANLPEHVIRDFALSPYYLKYNDILDKLGI